MRYAPTDGIMDGIATSGIAHHTTQANHTKTTDGIARRDAMHRVSNPSIAMPIVSPIAAHCDDAVRRLIWITPCKRSAARGKITPPSENCVAVQPTSGLGRRESIHTPSCACGLQGVIHIECLRHSPLRVLGVCDTPLRTMPNVAMPVGATLAVARNTGQIRLFKRGQGQALPLRTSRHPVSVHPVSPVETHGRASQPPSNPKRNKNNNLYP
jgi:hypothetical protein